jgi:hypothetical protein
LVFLGFELFGFHSFCTWSWAATNIARWQAAVLLRDKIYCHFFDGSSLCPFIYRLLLICKQRWFAKWKKKKLYCNE